MKNKYDKEFYKNVLIILIGFAALIIGMRNLSYIELGDDQIGTTIDAAEITNTNTTNEYENNKEIHSRACKESGFRRTNVKVDVGYGDREYYAYTNEYRQLVYVEAEEIKLQNEKTERVNQDGRYCDDEANVRGTESEQYDQGHVIADSLGGTSNAYNITPQDSDVNRSGGEQYYMEEQIRKAEESGKEVTDFQMTISYPNDSSQTPSSYEYSYKVDGKEVSGNFDNKAK